MSTQSQQRDQDEYVLVRRTRIAALSRALGNPTTVNALEGDTVEDCLLETAATRLTQLGILMPAAQRVLRESISDAEGAPGIVALWELKKAIEACKQAGIDAPTGRAVAHVRYTADSQGPSPDLRDMSSTLSIEHGQHTRAPQGDSDPIVGHKTYRNEDGSTRHEPLYESEARALTASIDEAKQRRAKLMPTDQDAATAMWEAWYRLKELGWRETCYGPTNVEVQLIEPGSSGIHRGTRWNDWPETTWWINGDSPSTPCLFKPIPGEEPQ